MAEDAKNQDPPGLRARESQFDRRLRQFRLTGQIEKEPVLSKARLNPTKEFETPALDSKRRPAKNDEVSEMERMAFHDPLTEQLNNRTILSRLTKELHRARRYKHQLGLLVLQIDELDRIGASVTPLVMETFLLNVSRVLGQNMREVDYRGSHEHNKFMIVCPETSLAELEALAERIRSKFSSSRVIHVNQNFMVTVSIGISSYPEYGASAEELIAAATTALNDAVKKGGNLVTRPEAQEANTNKFADYLSKGLQGNFNPNKGEASEDLAVPVVESVTPAS